MTVQHLHPASGVEAAECRETATVRVITDELESASDELRRHLSEDFGYLDFAKTQRLLTALRQQILHAPDAEVAECPGRLLPFKGEMSFGQFVTTSQCDACHRVVES